MNIQFWVNWHKWIGIVATLFVIILSITGVLLLHADGLKLYQRYIEDEWLLNIYAFNQKNLQSLIS